MGNCTSSHEKRESNKGESSQENTKFTNRPHIGGNQRRSGGTQQSSSLIPTSLNPPEQENSMPTNAYLVQPHQVPESKLCAFYAYYHYMNGEVDKDKFKAKVIELYKQELGMDDEDANNTYLDGNDPSLYVKKFHLKEEGSNEKALDGDRLIVADVTNGHFYAMIKSENTWWNYDSYHQHAPSKIGNYEQALTYLNEKKGRVFIS